MRVLVTLPNFVPVANKDGILQAGTQLPIDIALNRTADFTAPITAVVDSAPTGITGTFAVNAETGNTMAMMLRANVTVPPGGYQIRLKFTPPPNVGVGERVLRLPVQVLPPVTGSQVARIEIEPYDVEITAPASQQYAYRLYDANGAVIPAEAGGAVEWALSTSTPIVSMSPNGLVTGLMAGSLSVIARYKVNGVLIATDASQLTVYAAGTAGHYGSTSFSSQGNVRTLRRGESVTFQIIVRNTAGTAVTSGVSPVPTAQSSNTSVMTINPLAVGPNLTPGYFFDMTAAFAAPVGSVVRLRYDVTGAGGEVVIRIVP